MEKGGESEGTEEEDSYRKSEERSERQAGKGGHRIGIATMRA